jgi:hypothetical protein
MSNPFAETPLTAPTTNEPILVEMNARMVPIVLRALNRYKYRKSWASDADYETGLQQINTLQEAILTGVPEIVTSIDRLYRLVDSIHNGTAYTVTTPATPTAPAVVSPTIPDAPAAPDGITAGLRRQLLDSQGVLPSGWPFGLGDHPATLADVASSLKQSPATVDKTKELMTTLSEISAIEGGISAATGVVNTLGTWLTGEAEVYGEGLQAH